MSLREAKVTELSQLPKEIVAIATNEELNRIQILEIDGVRVRVRLPHNDSACDPSSDCKGYVRTSFQLGDLGDRQAKKCTNCRAHPLVNITLLQVETGIRLVHNDMIRGNISAKDFPQEVRKKLTRLQGGLKTNLAGGRKP